jgi:UDP-galactopyranose mutase
LGELGWRSLEFTTIKTKESQGNAIINYTDKNFAWTRAIEHNLFDLVKNSDFSIISYEFPKKWKKDIEPYYPISNSQNIKLYNDYLNLAKSKYPNFYFCGRLGGYKYLDMDDIISEALNLSQLLLKEE